uniref:Uncharacterized protein n=1 Tax=Lutzomyia longipalpis TaxID=7200 RepID=A0A1B0CSS6_LUTLO
MDYFWLFSYNISKPLNPKPAWNGYMQIVMETSSPEHESSSIEIVPFINLPPGDLSCIYTALKFATEQCRLQHQKTCFVTFDQPLYLKAREIAGALEHTNDLPGLIVRLGGFHLLMSFIGAVGYVMTGSGIEDMWAQVYASNTIPHMITGHAYSRSLRAHFLGQMALAKLIFKESALEINSLQNATEDIYTRMMDEKLSAEDATNDECIQLLHDIISRTTDSLSKKNRTAKLWINYFHNVNIMRQFIRAERTGNWQLHLQSIEAMLPYFHSSGHLNYAKSAHLYLQDMANLQNQMEPAEYQNFTEKGYFVIRRTNKFWSGVSVDITIEQELMRSFKTSGGLTHGRGINEGTLSKWIGGIRHCIPICNSLEEFCQLKNITSEQHVELRDSRKSRDFKDVLSFTTWLEQRDPFADRPENELASLSTGMIGDEHVNCDYALEIGKDSIKSMIGKSFTDVKLKRSSKVKPLSAMSNVALIGGDEVQINNELLMSRIMCLQDRFNTPLSTFLEYELSPRPLSLFDEVCMRKNDKSAIEKLIQKFAPCTSNPPENCRFIIDGGYLMHAVNWQRPATYNDICNAYVEYVKHHYGEDSIVIFDGYNDSQSTKYVEQQRRSTKKSSSNITVKSDYLVTTTKENFLGNIQNKAALILMLATHMQKAGICVLQSFGDADVLIVKTAIDVAIQGN